MGHSNRYSPEVRERAVRMVFEHKDEHESEWAAMQSIAFQSARVASQQLDVTGLRDPAGSRVRIDVVAARRAATASVGRLAAQYELDALVVRQFPSHGLTVWTAEVATSDGSLRARGVARAETGG